VHLLLTDRLSCPRCGPGFGLILLADELVERRVLEGALGCPNCRDRFPIEGGFADLRPPPRTPLGETPVAAPTTPEATEQLAALLGVAQGPGHVALLGSLAAHASALADLVPDVEVVAIDPGARASAEREGVSRLIAGPELPFHPWTFRALAVAGECGPIEPMAGLVARGGRIVVERPESTAAARLQRIGGRVMLDSADWLVILKETV
jgi:uncharacterized protein YbaR (Trm112 family)